MLKRHFISLIIFVVYTILALPLMGQNATYPVQVNVNLIPPYSLYLDDYTGGTSERISVTLLNNDIRYPSLGVTLRLNIKGNGFTLQSNSNIVLPPIYLEPNVPYRLSREDIAPLFNSQNLIANGLGTSGYQNGNRLPDGMLEFCFDVLEYNTGRLLSQKGCGTAWITVQKPPLLSLPLLGETVKYTEPLNLLFQWTPQHSGLSGVEYKLIIKQLLDNGMRPEAAFAYSPEVYSETLKSTSRLYDITLPALLPGTRYAWAVQAVAKSGIDEIRTFENNGLSEIWWFQVAEYCPPPLNITAKADRNRITISWTPRPEHFDFAVSYREKDKPGAEWFVTNTLQPTVTLYDVHPGRAYEYRIGTSCTPNHPLYNGNIYSIHLPLEDTTRNAQCGIAPVINLTNNTPLANLAVGEQFMAGDFPIFVTLVTGGNGTFSGEGYTIMPYLANARLAVRWDNIFINQQRQMTKGFVDAVYDASESQVVDVEPYEAALKELALLLTDQIQKLYDNIMQGIEEQVLADELFKLIENYPDLIEQRVNDDTAIDESTKEQLLAYADAMRNLTEEEKKEAALEAAKKLIEKKKSGELTKESAEKLVLNNLIPDDDFFAQNIINPKGIHEAIHKQAICILNDKGQTEAFIIPDKNLTTFIWYNDAKNTAYFKNGEVAPKNTYIEYVNSQYNRTSEPISWGINLAARDLGDFAISLTNSPIETTKAVGEGIFRIITLDFDIEKTWDRIINADVTDVSYVVSVIALGYLSGPGKSGILGSKDIAKFGQFLQQNISVIRKLKPQWAQLIAWYKLNPERLPFRKYIDMTQSEIQAFNHAISRHGHEFELKWGKQEVLPKLVDDFNEAVSNIRKKGTLVGIERVKYGVKGSGLSTTSVEAFVYNLTINGRIYYYWETLEGQFISAGLKTL